MNDWQRLLFQNEKFQNRWLVSTSLTFHNKLSGSLNSSGGFSSLNRKSSPNWHHPSHCTELQCGRNELHMDQSGHFVWYPATGVHPHAVEHAGSVRDSGRCPRVSANEWQENGGSQALLSPNPQYLTGETLHATIRSFIYYQPLHYNGEQASRARPRNAHLFQHPSTLQPQMRADAWCSLAYIMEKDTQVGLFRSAHRTIWPSSNWRQIQYCWRDTTHSFWHLTVRWSDR